jgi:hypothetical protein
VQFGATQATKIDDAKSIRKTLSLMISRRNKIAHEGDLQPPPLREPWPISRADLTLVENHIERVVKAIDAVV